MEAIHRITEPTTINEILTQVTELAALVFLVSSMTGIGPAHDNASPHGLPSPARGGLRSGWRNFRNKNHKEQRASSPRIADAEFVKAEEPQPKDP